MSKVYTFADVYPYYKELFNGYGITKFQITTEPFLPMTAFDATKTCIDYEIPKHVYFDKDFREADLIQDLQLLTMRFIQPGNNMMMFHERLN